MEFFLEALFVVVVTSLSRSADGVFRGIQGERQFQKGLHGSAIRANFIVKNQTQGRFLSTIEITNLSESCLFLNRAVKEYLQVTRNSQEPGLFLHLVSGKTLNAGQVSYSLAKVLQLGFPGCHDLKSNEVRKFSTIIAWFRRVSSNQIVTAGSWMTLGPCARRDIIPRRLVMSVVVART